MKKKFSFDSILSINGIGIVIVYIALFVFFLLFLLKIIFQ